MAKTRQASTLLELCVARATSDPTSVVATLKAAPKGQRVCAFIVMWAIAEREGGPLENVSQFARWWRQNDKERRSSARYLAEFRELFPEHPSPTELVELLPGLVDAAATGTGVVSAMTRPVAV